MTHRYSAVAIWLHWIIALMIGGMFLLGQTMKTADGQPIEWMYQLHKSIGISILVLTLARIVWRIMNPAPALPNDMRPLEKTVSKLAHVGFYTLLILLPLSGWVLVSASPFAVSTVLFGTVPWPHLPGLASLAMETREAWAPAITETHHILSKAMFVLLLLHVAGALKHEFGDEEGVMKRMAPGLLGETGGPVRPSRGAIAAFGTSAIFFGFVAGVPLAAQSLNQTPVPATEALANQNWVVDADDSYIQFSGTYQGETFDGAFDDWTASIAYDPANPTAVEATVDVRTGSVNTGSTLYDSTIKEGEWFNVSNFPIATVKIQGAKAIEDARYSADASMSIKGVDVPITLVYSLTTDGVAVIMEGTATLSRTRLDLGLSTDASGSTISDDIKVDVRVRATPSDADG